MRVMEAWATVGDQNHMSLPEWYGYLRALWGRDIPAGNEITYLAMEPDLFVWLQADSRPEV